MEVKIFGGIDMSRKSARESAMKVIYQVELAEISAQEALNDFFEHTEDDVKTDDRNYITDCVKGVFENIKTIDGYIEKYSKGWKINRIAKVDLAIMRLSIYEMLYREDVPEAVAVNEAVEIAKKFSGENASVFINGILGSVVREIMKHGEDTRN